MSIACVACGCHGWHVNDCPFYDGPRYYAPPSNALPAPQSQIESLQRALAESSAINAGWRVEIACLNSRLAEAEAKIQYLLDTGDGEP